MRIKVFETFAGIGSQLQALKNLANFSKLEVISLGAVEWYIDAIISYQVIHYGIKKPESQLSKIEMATILNKFNLSSDSKNPITKNYFNKKPEQWLREVFPYLNGFLNNTNADNFSDIRLLEKLPRGIDIFTYSFPCQDISQQGNQKGLGGGHS